MRPHNPTFLNGYQVSYSTVYRPRFDFQDIWADINKSRLLVPVPNVSKGVLKMLKSFINKKMLFLINVIPAAVLSAWK
jgi:hypothetical protein